MSSRSGPARCGAEGDPRTRQRHTRRPRLLIAEPGVPGIPSTGKTSGNSQSSGDDLGISFFLASLVMAASRLCSTLISKREAGPNNRKRAAKHPGDVANEFWCLFSSGAEHAWTARGRRCPARKSYPLPPHIFPPDLALSVCPKSKFTR